DLSTAHSESAASHYQLGRRRSAPSCGRLAERSLAQPCPEAAVGSLERATRAHSHRPARSHAEVLPPIISSAAGAQRRVVDGWQSDPWPSPAQKLLLVASKEQRGPIPTD
ncbi:unnamed protein product, partial [Polarella glacialis]